MRIERIERSKHKQERVLVFLEGGELLRLTSAELLHFDIYPGKDITAEEAAMWRAEAERSQRKQSAARMASGRMVSKAEVCRRMEKKGASRQEAADTADWLEELGAVDDAAYAGAVVRHYGTMGYGAARARQELTRRGVPKELWDGAISQLPPPEEAIRHFIGGKLRGREMTAEDSRKLTAALLRRGFSWQDIRPVLNEWGQEIEET